eukprot:944030-Amphidinium_carterae.3
MTCGKKVQQVDASSSRRGLHGWSQKTGDSFGMSWATSWMSMQHYRSNQRIVPLNKANVPARLIRPLTVRQGPPLSAWDALRTWSSSSPPKFTSKATRRLRSYCAQMAVKVGFTRAIILVTKHNMSGLPVRCQPPSTPARWAPHSTCSHCEAVKMKGPQKTSNGQVCGQ